MQFQNAILTEEGIRILQSGVSNNPVVFTRFLFTGSPTPLTAQTTALPEPTWGNGHVTNYAAGENGFVLYMMATNDTDYGYAYGFGVYGYLQNEGVENEKLLIVANYAGNVTYVSEASGSYTRFHLSITVSLSMTNSVLAIAPRYDDLVSNTAFQDLLERTVTTHSAADPMVGDPQIVRGQKHFYDTTYFGGDSNAPFIEIDSDRENGSMYLNAEHESQQIRIQMKPKDYGDDSNNNVYVNSNISPSGDGTVSLGVNEHRWLELNTYYVWASDTIGVSNQYGSTGMRPGGVEFLNGEGDSIGTIGVHNDEQLLIEGNGRPVHITALTVDGNLTVTGSFNPASLNIPSATIGNISATSVSTQEVDATGIRTTSLNAASVNGNNATIGSISTTSMTAQEVDATAAEIDSLIATNARVSALTIGGIAYQPNFTHPALFEQDGGGVITDIPIGSMFLAYIIIDPDNPHSTMSAGHITNIIQSIWTFQLRPVFDPLTPRFTTSFELTCTGVFSPNGGMQFQVMNHVPYTGGIALIMRVS